MAASNSTLGSCQFCGAPVADRHVIIRYETEDGATGAWAECPECGEIVDPWADRETEDEPEDNTDSATDASE